MKKKKNKQTKTLDDNIRADLITFIENKICKIIMIDNMLVV